MATGTKRQQRADETTNDQPTQQAITESQPQQTEGARGAAAGAGGVQTSPQQNGNGRASGALASMNEVQLARGLGWFSIGLGLAELLAPRGVARVAGMRGDTGLIRLFGLRELASGVAILSTGGKSAGAVWSRVVGDALDLACLGAAFASPDSHTGRLLFATTNVAGVTALDVLCARRLNETNGVGAEERGAKRVVKSIAINAAPEELYNFWHEFENLPRFMRHLESVTATGEARSHWVAKAPAGSTVEWDAEITEDRPNELIAWRSLEGSEVYNAGQVSFERAPGGRGTLLRVELDYTPPGGLVGVVVAKLFGEEPAGQLQEDLRRFKQIIELGEVVVSDATLPGTGLTEQRPAQPAGEGTMK